MIVAFDCRTTNITEHGAATLADHLVASGFLHTSLRAFRTLSDQRLTHSLFDRVSMVERIVLGS